MPKSSSDTKPCSGFTAQASELLTFVYGSDMHEAQMRLIGAKPVMVGVARLKDHCLSFHGHSPMWDSPLETIVPAPGHDLYGVIFEVSPADAKRLDAWHDARLDGSGPFFHSPEVVFDANGHARKVLLYKKDILGSASLPSQEYLSFIIAGAAARGLPSDYLDELAAIAARPAGYAVPQPLPSGRSFEADYSCASCAQR